VRDDLDLENILNWSVGCVGLFGRSRLEMDHAVDEDVLDGN